MICFYHSADLDGHCSGAIVKKKYPDCEMYGINYGDSFPWEKAKGQKVIMVDFSLQPFDDMITLNEFSDLTLIDHHKTTIEDYAKFYSKGNTLKPMNVVFDDKKAGCELTWEFLFGNVEMPKSVILLGRYDVWDLDCSDEVMPFQWGFRLFRDTYPDNQKLWKIYLEDEELIDTQEVIETGKILLQYRDSENAKYIKGFAFDVDFEGMKFTAINKGMTNSQTWDSIWDESKYDGMISFVWKKGQWTVSLYTTKDIDLSSIAKKYGGGGHKQACGFQCAELPFTLPRVA